MSAELWFAIVSLALGFIGVCFSALASIIAYFVKKGEDAQDRSIGELRQGQISIEQTVSRVQQTLARYETHIGAGDKKLSEIRQDISDHVTKEEQIFWKKVDSITEAQRIFSEAVLQRIASMEARLPNGELKQLALAVVELRGEVGQLKEMARAAIQHVQDHDEEAEDWKRRIVALESARGLRAKK